MFIQRGNNNLEIEIADNPAFLNTYSLDFDGVDDIVRLGTPSTVGTGGINTLSFWVKANAQSTTSISDYLFSDDGVSGYNWWRFFHGNGTDLYWRNINGVAFNLAPNLFDGNWHNVVVIRNPSDLVNGSLRVYVDNGTPIDRTLDYRYGVAGFYNGALGTIGNNRTASSGFNGIIDEVSVWNSEITPSDVASIYNSGSPTDLSLLPTPPINWYRMGDNGSWKSPQWLLPNNENKDKVSNYSMAFDGIDDHLELTTTLDLGINCTISLWVKRDRTGTVETYLGSSANSFAWLSYIATSNILYFKVGTTQYSFSASPIATILNDTTNWINITWQRSGNILELFLNGVPMETRTGIGTVINTTLDTIGTNANGASGFLGNIDEVACWDTNTINPADIYNGGTPTTLPSGAVAHWRMGEETNFTSNWLVDNSALDNYSKRSFYFDGTDQYLNVGGLSTLASASSFSISLWVNKGTSGTNYRRICGKYTSASDNILLEFSGTNIFPRFYVTNGGVSSYVTANVGLTFNTWQNLVVVFDGSLTGNQNRAKIYLDGNNITATDVGTIPATTSADASDFYFGKANGLGVFYWLGNQDEAAIFNYPLTPTEVAAISAGGVPNDLVNTVGVTPPTNNWRMGEDASFNGTNWTVPDNVGTNDGTSVNMDVDDLVGEAPNYSGGGISSGMTIEDRVGNAPNSENNALSYNMESVDRTTDVPT